MLESVAVNIVHHDEEAALILAEIDGTHHVRTREPRKQLKLALETLHQLALGGGLAAEHLDSVEAIGFEIAPDVDGCHAAAAALIDQFVAVLQHVSKHSYPSRRCWMPRAATIRPIHGAVGS